MALVGGGRAAAPPPPKALTGGNNPRGTAITPEFHAAVQQVFHAQPARVQQHIMQAAVANPSHPASRVILSGLHGQRLAQGIRGASRVANPRVSSILSANSTRVSDISNPTLRVPGLVKDLGGAAGSALSFLDTKLPGTGGIGDVRTEGGFITPSNILKASNRAAQDVAGGLAQFRASTKAGSASGPADITSFGNLGPQVAQNAAKDLVNLPAEALVSLAIPAGEAAQGHWGQALHTITGPYVQMFEHPAQAFAEHPVNTALMAAGLVHPVTRVADTAQTLLRTGKLPNVKAEPVQLTANLTHERPDYSKYPLIRRSQKDVAKSLYKRNEKGQLVPRSDAVRNRLIKLETSRLVGQNERVRVAHREQQINQHAATVMQPRVARIAHGVRTAAKYNPEPALIPGTGVLARIADGTIRRVDTIAQDLHNHLSQVEANKSNLAGRPKLVAEHEAYVKQIQDALNNKAFLRNPQAAFDAATRYAKDYAQIERAAHLLGHFRDMTKSALERRVLAHIVLTHMPDAHYNADRGLMVGDRPLTTEEMRQFAAKETGGRPLAFTSDQARAGDRAFYVNGQKRPLTAAKGNEYFAFTHGLTHPGHESLLEQRVRTQGIVDAHNAMNRLAEQLLLQNERTARPRAWASYKAALHDAPQGYVPIRLAQQFHPKESLLKALQAGNVNLATLEEEAASRQLDINSRLQPSSEPGQYGLIHESAAAQLRAHENQISPGVFFRAMRGLTNQFRRVALATSFRHLPGVFQEQLIRAAAEGIGPISWLAGRAALQRARELNPKLGEQRRIEMTGGLQQGQVLALSTHYVSRHFAGTLLEGPLNAFEKLLAAPGARQAANAWRAWVHFTLQGTKRFLSDNVETAAIGKQVISDFGGRHGLLAAAMGKWGQMVDQAARGVLDERTARQMGAYVRRVYGRWVDLTPGEQQALMFSPFGMWWTNSIAWLMRMPVDHPVGAAFFAALNTGTEKQRQALGLDMFSPNHLPLYQQGSIPLGQQLWGANYYSAFGVANNPGETATSLLVPWQAELVKAAQGQDWKGSTISSPANPHPDRPGGRKPTPGEVATVILNSLLGSFMPLYTKAQTIVEGGASKYDTSTLWSPQTKEPNPGPLKGLEKAVMPIRLSNAASGGGSSSKWWSGGGSSSGGSWWTKSGSGSSSWWK